MDNTTKELRKYADKHKVSNLEDAKHDVIPVVQDIVQKIMLKDQRFKILEIEYSGSIYQRLKIDDPDEFDFDLPLAELEIEQALPGPSQEFAHYKLQPHQITWSNLANPEGKLSSERLVQTFASLVSEAVDDLNREKRYAFEFDFKTNHPAVTLKFIQCEKKKLYNVDLVPTIKIRSWPNNLTRGWESRSRNGWPSADMINEVKMLSVSLVPKLPKGLPLPNRDIAWRYSFNNAEKVLLLDSEPAIANNCRRPVLRVLKSLRVDYKWPGLRSYHLKTVMLHEFESQSIYEWTNENFLPCLLNALRRLEIFLQNKKCPHYFLPGMNLFEKLSNADCNQIIRDINRFMDNQLESLEKLNGKESKEFQIFVRDFNGKTMTLWVKNELTIDGLKNKIAEKKGMDKSQFQLSYNGEYLQSGTIQSNGIKKEIPVEMQGGLRGGKNS